MKIVLFLYLRQTLRCHYLDVHVRVEPSTCLSKEPPGGGDASGLNHTSGDTGLDQVATGKSKYYTAID